LPQNGTLPSISMIRVRGSPHLVGKSALFRPPLWIMMHSIVDTS
jgi:hypothetical protein